MVVISFARWFSFRGAFFRGVCTGYWAGDVATRSNRKRRSGFWKVFREVYFYFFFVEGVEGVGRRLIF